MFAFIEGVSGVGKSTTLRLVAQGLREAGRSVEAWAEFDFANPIDFYCTAYLPAVEFAELPLRFPGQAEALRRHAVPAGEAVLVRYYDGDTPLFPEPLLSELAGREFCYHPRRAVPMEAYTAAYRAVWKRFAARSREDVIYLFDGSLLHHPLNDLLRNYRAAPDAMAAHVRHLLGALGGALWQVFYLRTNFLPGQLARAHRDRGQEPPTDGELAFWRERAARDRYVLREAVGTWREWDIDGGWDEAREGILHALI